MLDPARFLCAVAWLVVQAIPAVAAPPVAPAISSQAATEGQSFQFTAPRFTDPDGDSLTYQFEGLPDWLIVPYPGLNARYIAGRPSYAVSSKNLKRTYLITLVATDATGLSAHAPFELAVTNVNDPPVPPAQILAPEAREGEGYQYTLPQFVDPDGDALTYGFAGLPSWLTVCYPALNPRYVCGKPPFSESTAESRRSYEITVSARDALNNASSKSFSLAVANVNQAPVPPRAIAAPPATEGVKYSFTVPPFSDSDGDTLTYTFSGLPSWLSAPYPSSPRFLATTAALGFPPFTESTPSIQKVYTVEVTATDSDGRSASKSFALAVTNSNAAPTPPPSIPPQVATENVGFGFTVPQFRDIDNDVIRYSFVGLPAWLTVAYPDTNPRYLAGRPPYTESSMAIDAAYRIDVVANDGNGGIAAASFFLIVANANQPPTPPGAPAIDVFEGRAFASTVPQFADPDGDRVTYSAQQLPAWLQFDPLSRSLTGTAPVTELPDRATTSYPVEIRGTDPAGASSTLQFSIVASPPTKSQVIAVGTLLGLSPDGSYVVYAGSGGNVYRRNLGNGATQAHSIGGWARIDLAPDGRFLAYSIFDGALAGQCEIAASGNTCASVYVLDLETGARFMVPLGGSDVPIVTVASGGELVAVRYGGVYHHPSGQSRRIYNAIQEMQAAGTGGRIVMSNFAEARLFDWPSDSTIRFDDGAGGATIFRNVSITEDGALVALDSNRALVTGTKPGRHHVYLRDSGLGTYTLVSSNESGTEANAPATAAGVSPDGRYVAFSSQATNLVAGKRAYLFIKDTVTGLVTPIHGCESPALSALPTRLACQAGEEVWIVDPIRW